MLENVLHSNTMREGMRKDIDELSELLSDKKETHLQNLECLVDEYWVKWRDTNKKIISNSGNPDATAKVGAIAPSIRIYSGKKLDRITLRWRVYANNWARVNLHNGDKKKLQYANEIPRLKDGTTSKAKLYAKATSWEVELIDEFLAEANPLINFIKLIHEIQKQVSKFEVTPKNEEQENGE